MATTLMHRVDVDNKVKEKKKWNNWQHYVQVYFVQ